jgi:hypothetical protein
MNGHGGKRPGKTLWAMRRVAVIHRDIVRRPIMKKLGMLGIIGGAALLPVAPLSLKWSQDEVFLSLNSVNAQIIPGVHRRAYRRTYHRAAYAVAGYGYGSYYGYSFPYYSSYYAPQPYSSYYRPVGSYAPSRYSCYLPPYASPPATAITCHPLRA